MAIRSAKLGLALAGLAIGCGALKAQRAAAKPIVDQPSPYPASGDDWSGSPGLATGTTIFVLTDAKPTRRQLCHIRSIDAKELQCARHHGVSTFQKSEVQALIAPGGLGPWKPGFGFYMGAGAALIVVATALSVVGGPVTIILGSVLLVGPPAIALSAPHHPEKLLYLRPGTALSVKLNR